MTTIGKMLHTLGNLLMLTGLYLLLFVGGLFADEQYNVYAASGANDARAPVVAAGRVDEDMPTVATPLPPLAPSAPSATAPVQPALPARVPGRLSQIEPDGGSEGQLTNAVPAVAADTGSSTLTRIVIPAIEVDKKVVEVGWTVEQQPDGQAVAIWDVDKYRVGHHRGTRNPGGGGNIVLAGHSGGKAYPFNDIYYLKPGALLQLYSNGEPHDYTVSEHILLDEVGQPLEKRLENARYIGPADEELVTMVACWPLTGPDKFKQRIVIRAKPAGTASRGD
ncbi:MAG TPA: sortase [Herpetosiphonaceae bacterium]|nr:sortase [Herpetosiphonaceae bacterium]